MKNTKMILLGRLKITIHIDYFHIISVICVMKVSSFLESFSFAEILVQVVVLVRDIFFGPLDDINLVLGVGPLPSEIQVGDGS